MLGEVEHDRPARDLQVRRRARVEAVLPVDLEAEPVHVERLGEGEVEDPQDGDGRLQGHRITLGLRKA